MKCVAILLPTPINQLIKNTFSNTIVRYHKMLMSLKMCLYGINQLIKNTFSNTIVRYHKMLMSLKMCLYGINQLIKNTFSTRSLKSRAQ